jgi:hypothetical protein
LLVRAAKERGAVEELLAAAPMRMEEVPFDMIKNMGLFSGGGSGWFRFNIDALAFFFFL